MKKTFRQTVSAALFFCCFLLLFMGVSEIMRRKTDGSTDMIHSFYDLERNSLDMLVVGSSHCYYGFSPNVLWGEYGISSYTLGSPSQSVSSSYFLLKEALRYQKPKVVMLESYGFYYDGLYTKESRVRAAFDGIRLGKAKREMVETYFHDVDFKEKLSYYIPFLMYHSRWDELKDSDFHINSEAWLLGSKLSLTEKEYKNPGMEIETREIPEVNKEYFDKIQKLCEEEGIMLVVFATPFAHQKKDEYQYRQGINLSLETYLEEKGIPFLFFQKTGEAEIDYKTDFTDSEHLNWKGQKKISQCIGKYLSQTVGFTSHAGEEGYERWEWGYEKYLEAIE